MTAEPIINPIEVLSEQIERAEPDLLRALLKTFVEALMGAEADAACGAAVRRPQSEERINSRNGYRVPDVGHPGRHDRAGHSPDPDRVLLPRVAAATPQAGRAGADHRGRHLLPARGSAPGGWRSWSSSLGVTALSKSQVSVMAAELDEHVADFRSRPLDAGPYTFVAADALVLKVREGGRIVGVHALTATGVNADGHKEILGLQVTTAEDGAGWLALLPRPDRPRPVRGQAGHLRRASRPGGRPSAPPCRARRGSDAAPTTRRT